jgi:hypothetical protein
MDTAAGQAECLDLSDGAFNPYAAHKIRLAKLKMPLLLNQPLALQNMLPERKITCCPNWADRRKKTG